MRLWTFNYPMVFLTISTHVCSPQKLELIYKRIWKSSRRFNHLCHSVVESTLSHLITMWIIFTIEVWTYNWIILTSFTMTTRRGNSKNFMWYIKNQYGFGFTFRVDGNDWEHTFECCLSWPAWRGNVVVHDSAAANGDFKNIFFNISRHNMI